VSLKEKAEKVEKENDEVTEIHNVDISKIQKQDESIKELQANLEASKRINAD
jgi:GH25 family lysozyme M1 (1,4-beta-N-acetylmuramidase)